MPTAISTIIWQKFWQHVICPKKSMLMYFPPSISPTHPSYNLRSPLNTPTRATKPLANPPHKSH